MHAQQLPRGETADFFLKKAQLVLLVNLILNRYGQLFSKGVIKPFIPNAPFLYPLKTSEKVALVTNGLRGFSKNTCSSISVTSLQKKRNFPLRISPVNVTKSAGNCGVGHIY